MIYTTLFFDLDETLYPPESGLWPAIQARMSRFMHERLDIPLDTIPGLRRTYYETYGTTLRGLQLDYHVDADEYLAYVHDLPLDTYLKPNPKLREILRSLPQQRFIFTNSDAAHAGRVLKILQLENCFTSIIDVRALEFACKPEALAFQRALAFADHPAPEACMLFDDVPANLKAARQQGITTVRVGENGREPCEVDYQLADLLDLPEAIPHLWLAGLE